MLKRIAFVVSLFAIISLSSCTQRLVDFTVISSKNVDLNLDKSKGKKVVGKKSYFLGFGWNVKDAMDKAIESGGKGYDLLIDGVVKSVSYPFVSVVVVEGTAMNSSQMKKSMGAANYEKWLRGQNVFDPATAPVQEEVAE
ncbi:hypothetical protein WAF17_17240 [Bernardetia sp. ABR2-2B]|uniref:hypothetical protein n=1 Tax=Bernardetia sp. ABR2-2B TaxID=3127472 RepID=UPI0030D388EB